MRLGVVWCGKFWARNGENIALKRTGRAICRASIIIWGAPAARIQTAEAGGVARAILKRDEWTTRAIISLNNLFDSNALVGVSISLDCPPPAPLWLVAASAWPLRLAWP